MIYDEQSAGKMNRASALDFDKTSDDLLHRGADAVLLGWTELALLVQESFNDGTRVHTDAA